MAEPPVSRPNTKWIWIALIVLLAVVFLLYIFALPDEDDVDVTGPPALTSDVEPLVESTTAVPENTVPEPAER